MTAKKKAAPKKKAQKARPITEARLIEMVTEVLCKGIEPVQSGINALYELGAEHYQEHVARFGEHRRDIQALAASIGVLEAAYGAQNQIHMTEPRLMDLPQGISEKDLEPFGRSPQEDALFNPRSTRQSPEERERYEEVREQVRTTAAPPELVRGDYELVDDRGTVFTEAIARLEENTRRVTQIRRELCGYNDRLYGEQPTTAGLTSGLPDIENDGYVYQLIRLCAHQADMLSELDQELERLNGLV